MQPLPQNYDHTQVEKKWQKYWEENQIYIWRDDQSRDQTFVIDTPPPTVSGILHMGHIFSYTQADFIARYQRMRGKDVFYPMGFDDNGLPTERLVEKVKKIRPADIGREKFIEVCEEVSQEARKEFRHLFESVALSVDWRQEYHTISQESRKISQASFLDLFNKERAYRKLQPMFWDPIDQTAIAQAEIEDKELNSQFNDIYFGIDGTDEKIVIATTRPELLGACVAVFYNPDDNRYKHLHGKKAITALFGVKVPILADEHVKIDKGTGLVMCCTFGDETDIMWWKKHQLDTRIILNKYGKIDVKIIENEGINFLDAENNSNIGQSNSIDVSKTIACFNAISGRKVSNHDPKSPGAREITISMLKDAALLVKQEPITHAVKCAERSGAPLEIIPTYQWFIKILDQREQLKSKAAICNWYPEYMQIRVNQWIDGLSWDWCISRQRYFGVPFPIWYSKRPGEEGKILLPNLADLPVNPLVDLPHSYSRQEVIAEEDVMDTWATSSISPQLSSKAITKDYAIDFTRHKKLFPADLRPQAHEIIRTWAFYTIVKAHLHEDTIPWKNLMISGWCLAADKSKMSKSKGNVVTPVGLIEEKGADVVRFWASTSRLGCDTAFSEDVLKIGKKLVTKLWNATKFAAIHLDKINETPGTALQDIANNIINQPLDLWILTRLKHAITIATNQFEKFEYCEARIAIEDFFWNDFCDNYLELVKGRIYGEQENKVGAAQKSAIYTTYHCLDGILRLFAPIVPHITDELYTHIFDNKITASGSIHARGNWPNAVDYPDDKKAENGGIAAVNILNAVRKLKAERNVSIKWPLNFIAITGANAADSVIAFVDDLKNVTSAAEITFTTKTAQDGQFLSTTTEDGKFNIVAEFAISASN